MEEAKREAELEAGRKMEAHCIASRICAMSKGDAVAWCEGRP